MILTIDIGNTTTSFGVFQGKRLVSHFSIATQPNRTPDEVTLQLKALAKTKRLRLWSHAGASRGATSRARPSGRVEGTRLTQIILCSVVPRMSSVLIQSLRFLKAVPIRVVGQDLVVPLKNRYTYPEQVGHDRLVGAYAAWTQWRGNDCIVADFGTAITIDLVTKKGEYLGGVIAPGLDISLEALATRTALLPRVELREPPELLGRDTANSIRSGLLHGCVALCDGIVTQMKRRYAPGAVIVATGGAGPLIAKHSRTITHLRPHLVLEGLALLSHFSNQ